MRFLSLLPLVALSTLNTVRAADVDTLNYALTLENLEASFYANNPFKQSDYTNAGYDPSVYTYVNFIAAHEAAHVATLKSVISSLGGTPVSNCTSYPFASQGSYQNVTTFLQTALFLEGTGVTAYDGAINTISTPALQQAAATIATIEARHANYLSMVLNNQTVPVAGGATDTAVVPSQIVSAVTPYLANCPSTNPTFNPVIRTAPNASLPVSQNNGAAGTVGNNDLNALQYALTLENLEAAFYNKYVGAGSNVGQFNSTSFAKYPAGTFGYLQLIANHEASHVSALRGYITNFGGTPVNPCTYNFGNIATADQFVSLAAAIEQAGVSAYDGAINTISNTAVAQVAATIATVEARHSQFLNTINFNVLGGSPSALPAAVPTSLAFDPAVNPANTYSFVAANFITACPTNNAVFALPIVPSPGYNATGSSTGAAGSSSGAAGSSAASASGSSAGGGGGGGAGSSSAGAGAGSSGAAAGSSGAAAGSSGAAAGSTGRGAGSCTVPSFAAMFAAVLIAFGFSNKRFIDLDC